MANKQIRDISVANFFSSPSAIFKFAAENILGLDIFFSLVRLNYAPNKNYAFSNALKSQHFSQANEKKQHPSKRSGRETHKLDFPEIYL